MKWLSIITLVFSFQTTFSQSKLIKSDTVYWYRNSIELQNTLGLKDLEQSTDEFNFRLRGFGQIIEITKDSSKYIAEITNYTYHTKKCQKRELLTSKIILSPTQANEVYNLIHKANIINLPTDKTIKNWMQGFDGITYIVEYADKNNYCLKTYWTPTAQDSIPEALIVQNFVNSLSNTLKLEEKYETFQNTLPKQGCYSRGGLAMMCYISNSLELGYSGATKLPLGFYVSYAPIYIGKTKINSSGMLQYNLNSEGFHHLNLQFSKWNIFYNKENLSDFIAYNYQNRTIKMNDTQAKFQNHQIKYGLNLKNNIGIGLGLDYIDRKSDKFGGHLYAYKAFTKPNISTTWTTTILDNRFNYKVDLIKSLYFTSKFPIRRISLGLTYEDFMNYKDLYFSLRIVI